MAGKYISPKKHHWAPFVVILAVAALVATIGGTMAWLTASPSGLTNTFTPANVEIEVTETFDGTTKSNVNVENKSDVPVYVRATVVVNWLDAEGKVCADAHDGNFNFTWPSSWTLGSDGYYYYNQPLAVDGKAEIIGTDGVALSKDGNCSMQVTFLAQAIQAEPAEAVLDAWETGVTSVVDGNLTIKTGN